MTPPLLPCCAPSRCCTFPQVPLTLSMNAAHMLWCCRTSMPYPSLLLCLGKSQCCTSSKSTFALLGAQGPSALQRLGIEPKMDAATVGLIFGKFLYLFLASLVLGLVLGLFSALLLKKFNVSQTPQVMDALQSKTGIACTKLALLFNKSYAS